MMETERIQSIIMSAMTTMNVSRESDEQLEIGVEAPIFGPDSMLDSLGLVSLLIDIEELFADEGITIALSDERAMSQKRTPYRDVPTLTAFIESQISENLKAQ